MEIWELSGLVLMLMLISFALGASIMWSLEGRSRRQQPLWLVVIRSATLIGLTSWVFFRPGRGDTTPIIDPGWMTALGIFAVAASILAFGIELRQRRQHRAAEGSGGREAP